MELPHPQSKPLLLDGATGTNLLAHGMPFGICVEEWILQNPDVIKKIQSKFIDAGCDIIYAPTFSANRAKLEKYGLQDNVEQINVDIVNLTRSVSKDKLVAGNISQTGLIAEPFGDAKFADLIDIYKEQANALYKAGVDLFVIETMSSLAEVRAAVIACKRFEKPIFVTITISENGKTFTGSTPLNCLIVLQSMGVSGFGLNCSCGPEAMYEVLEEIMPFAKIPIIAKPNAGQPNPLIPNKYDLSPEMMAQLMKPILETGVSIIGGCCGTTSEHLIKLRELIDSTTIKKPEYDYTNDIYLANETEFFALDNDRIEFSELIECGFDMADDFIAAESESYDVLWISINSPEDAKQFGMNAHLAKLPVCFKSDDEVSLKSALLLYNGRCLVDSQTSIEEEELFKIAQKYGAVVY